MAGEQRVQAVMRVFKPIYIVSAILLWNIGLIMFTDIRTTVLSAPKPSPPPSHPTSAKHSRHHSSEQEVLQRRLHRAVSPSPLPNIEPSINEPIASTLLGVDQKLSELNSRLRQLESSSRKLAKPVAQWQPAPSADGGAVEKQTIFLPVGPNDFERFRNLYVSMVKFFRFEEIEEWIIVTPKRDSDVVRSIVDLTSAHKGLFRILEDTEAVPKLKDLPTSNWMTQQVIKIGGADHVKTRFYFVLDSDLLLFKPTGFGDLITNGRAITNVYDSRTGSTRADWWESAEKVLDMTLDTPTYFGVTPAFLSTDIVKGLQERIKEVHNKDWATFLLENVYTYTFTEYTMYYVFAQGSGLYQQYHAPVKNGVYNHELSVWFKHQFAALDLGHIVKYGAYLPGHFIVVQSNTDIAASEVADKMGAIFWEAS